MIKNYILLGPPGAGKGTLAKLLEKEKGITHISTGVILREAINSDSEIGKKVKKYVRQGKYVPDKIMNLIVKNKLSEKSVMEKGFVLDGYPRTINQANFLKKNNFKINHIILLKISEEEVMKRLVNRKRKDDVMKIIKDRLKVFHKKTLPLIRFYKKENLLKEIDASGTIKENLKRILAIKDD